MFWFSVGLFSCICCTQVGKLGDALQELVDTYQPDRILLETSGSSFPAPLAREVRKDRTYPLTFVDNVLNSRHCFVAVECFFCVFQLRRLTSTGMAIELDAIICVIDAVNFKGYSDKSATAKIQAKYTDLILINKHEVRFSIRQASWCSIIHALFIFVSLVYPRSWFGWLSLLPFSLSLSRRLNWIVSWMISLNLIRMHQKYKPKKVTNYEAKRRETCDTWAMAK